MELYATTKNIGPTSFGPGPLFLVYLGPSLEEARKAVGDFQKYEKPMGAWYKKYPDLYSAIPRRLPRKFVAYYMADGWWYTIVKINFE